jgi:hypothetical protein
MQVLADNVISVLAFSWLWGEVVRVGQHFVVTPGIWLTMQDW